MHLDARRLFAGLAFVRFRYHVTFINVVFGALIFADERDGALAVRLAALYLSFNVFLYSGLYAINDLTDRESDAAHPLKRARPIPSGRVSVREARIWALLFLVVGAATGRWFGPAILACYLAVTVINVAYSGGGRNVVYVDVLLNALPHTVRFLMGAVLVGRRPPFTHLVALLLLAVAFSCLRRRIEMDAPGWEARQSLRAWSLSRLNRVMGGALATLVALTIWKSAEAPGFYAALVGTAAVLGGGAYTSPLIRRGLTWVWTH